MKLGRATGIALPAVAAALLAGCQQQPEAPPPAARLPAKVCDNARQGLERLSGTGTFEYKANGEATIDQATWLSLSPHDRDQLGQVLAFHAACGADEPPREQIVTIRSEYGMVLTRRVVETSADLSRILQD